jgi:SAM-dependent methyltransferase
MVSTYGGECRSEETGFDESLLRRAEQDIEAGADPTELDTVAQWLVETLRQDKTVDAVLLPRAKTLTRVMRGRLDGEVAEVRATMALVVGSAISRLLSVPAQESSHGAAEHQALERLGLGALASRLIELCHALRPLFEGYVAAQPQEGPMDDPNPAVAPQAAATADAAASDMGGMVVPVSKRQSAPAVSRNQGPILEVLRRALPSSARVLEIASGTGEHAVYFARHLSQLTWQPSDANQLAVESIRAWLDDSGLTNVLPPIELDVLASPWPLASIEDGPVFDALVNINMIHISPWECTVALFRGAQRAVGPEGVIYLYGPYKRGGAHTAPSNADFDEWLRQRDERYGVRDLDDVLEVAGEHGFTLEEIVEMPANNLSVLLKKS